YPDTLRFVGKMHNRLLTIGKGSGPYIFRLADIQTSQWAEFSQNQWTPQEEVVRSAKAYNTDDYVLYKIQSWDMEENIIQRFYFLKVEQSVSNDDPINPPVVLNAYPNPFKDRIRISTKDSPQPQPLDIYNLRGQKVKSLAPAADGYEWDGRDEQGNPVSVGIYFARNPHSKSAIKLVKLQP
ncbi:MAG: T9SS type A sorting domain-containing protein, partial [Candidatus Cloacimonetes bacterium]|nr:T9SS type A sorting domain-containing protein [Candidatus Cloacimonadota bacterium]